MSLTYNFLQDQEPTEAQLEVLMDEVGKAARNRRIKADVDFKKSIQKEIKSAEQRKVSYKKAHMDVKMKPKLLIIAGPNGSGKTSIASKIVKNKWMEGCVYINPDIIARDIFGDWNSPESVLRAAQYATQQREECIKNRESLLFETVLSASDKLEFVVKAQEAGYYIRLFFVGTDHPAINASRIAHRVLEGGHDVPISKIVSRYAKSIANCSQAAQVVDRMYVYDNSIDDAPPKLLFKTVDGKVDKEYAEVNLWAQGIMLSLSE